jgi:hypothetical protein
MSLVVATALLWLAVPGASAPKRLAVVQLVTPSSMTGLAAQVTQILLRHAPKQKFSALSPDQIRAKLGESGHGEVLECGLQPACLASVLQPLNVDFAAVGALSRDEQSYLLKLRLVDLKALRVTSEVDKPILIASRRFVRDVDAAIPSFLRGEAEPLGTLQLVADVEGAQVILDGEAIGMAPLTRQVKSGKHQVQLQKPEYLTISRLVTIEAGASTQEQFRLIQEPSQPALPELAVAPRTDQGALRIPWAAWVAAGVGVAAAGTGVAFGLSSKSIENNLRSGFVPGLNRYVGTRSDAQVGRRNAQLANAFYAVAGASLLTGAVLIYFSNRSGAGSGLHLETSVGAREVVVRGQF